MFQSLTIVGNVGQDPVTRYTQSGKECVNFSCAVRDFDKSTVWFRVQAWGKTADVVKNYVHKGTKVIVVGRLLHGEDGNPKVFTTKNGETKTQFDVMAERITLITTQNAQQGGGGYTLQSNAGQWDDIAV